MKVKNRSEERKRESEREDRGLRLAQVQRDGEVKPKVAILGLDQEPV